MKERVLSKKIIVASVCFVLTLVLVVGIGLGWYGGFLNTELNPLNARVVYLSRYFESGNGKSSDEIVQGYDSNGDPIFNDGFSSTDHVDPNTNAAYEIKTPDQLYNLAWLQYMGYFNIPSEEDADVSSTYFYLSADLDMTGYILPPIGTTENPFIGSFDGNGYTISNLIVSNVRSDMEASAYVDNSELPLLLREEIGSNALEDVNIVGFFGVVGNYNDNADYDTSDNQIVNVTLDGIEVRSKTSSAISGLAVGYVEKNDDDECPLSGVVVTGASELVNTATSGVTVDGVDLDNLSEFTLVGYAADDVCKTSINKYEQDVDVKNETGKWMTSQLAGATWGNSIDMYGIYGRLRYAKSLASHPITYTDTEKVTYKKYNQASAETIYEGGTKQGAMTKYYMYDPNVTGGGTYISYEYGYRYMELAGITGTGAGYRNYLEDSITKDITAYEEQAYTNQGNNTPAVIISDGSGNYLGLTVQNGQLALTNVTTRAEAARWYQDGSTLSIWAGVYNNALVVPPLTNPTSAQAATVKRYYLINGGTVPALSESSLGISDAWTITSSGSQHTIANGDYYLNFDGTWKISSAGFVISDSNSNYLSVSNGSIVNSNTPALWYIGSDSRVYTVESGTVYYLTYNNLRKLSLTTSAAQVWELNSNTHQLHIDDYYLAYDTTNTSYSDTDGWGLTNENFRR